MSESKSEPKSVTKGDGSESRTYEHAKHWANVFLEEFAKESDRASVIVAASIFDDGLTNLLRQYLVPNPSSADDLFDGTNAPLSTFSAKIAMAYRLGLISSPFARNLHLIRRIRNEFAHQIHGCSFEDSAIKSRVLELYKSQRYRAEDHPKLYPKGARGQFLTVCLWMLWRVNSEVAKIEPLQGAQLEFGFLEKEQPNSSVEPTP